WRVTLSLHGALPILKRDGALLAGGHEAREQLLPLERLSPAVLFHDQKRRLLPALVRGKAPLAPLAQAPPPHGRALVRGTRVQHFRGFVSAVRAAHGRFPLAVIIHDGKENGGVSWPRDRNIVT